MKILQIFGAVVAVHLLAFIFIFASPGCQSGPRNVPTPDATLPSDPAAAASAPYAYNANAAPHPVDLGTAPANYAADSSHGHASPTRPGSPAAVAIAPSRATQDVAPVSTYTIVRGDSLWSVAKRNNLTVAELAKANRLSTGVALKPGQKLIIPGKPGVPAAQKEVAVAAPAARSAGNERQSSAATADGVKHTVQSGESLGVIARKYQVSVGELAAANNITDPSKVRAGQQLVIPGFKAVGARSNGTSANRAAAPAKPVVTAPASPAVATPATTAPATTTPPPASNAVPHFEITAPPPGQDLDSGLKETTTEVPTIKVEESSGQ